MKKKLPLILLSMMIGGCLSTTAPAFADQAARVAEATIMILVRDMETGANRTLICAPVNVPANPEPVYH